MEMCQGSMGFRRRRRTALNIYILKDFGLSTDDGMAAEVIS